MDKNPGISVFSSGIQKKKDFPDRDGEKSALYLTPLLCPECSCVISSKRRVVTYLVCLGTSFQN